MDVHHYCGALDEDLIQCVLLDGNVVQVKLGRE